MNKPLERMQTNNGPFILKNKRIRKIVKFN